MNTTFDMLTGTSFTERGLRAITAFPKTRSYTGEDIRSILTADGIRPRHHNAWGSLILTAVRRGVIRPTGLFRRMWAARSHGRSTALYEVL